MVVPFAYKAAMAIVIAASVRTRFALVALVAFTALMYVSAIFVVFHPPAA